METNEFYQHLDRINSKEKALSYSALSSLLKSPSHYYKYVMEKELKSAMKKTLENVCVFLTLN